MPTLVHEVMQFSVMVIKERLKQQRKTTKQFRGREMCIFVHTLRSTIHLSAYNDGVFMPKKW